MEILLNRDRISAGERLTGIVKLETEVATCREVVVSLLREEMVNGRSSNERYEVLRVLRPSIEAQTPFSADIVSEAPTYHGRLLRIDHSVIARAALDEGGAVEVRTSFFVQAGAVTSSATKDRRASSGCANATALAFILAGAVLIVGSSGAFEPSVAGSITALVGFVLLGSGLRRRRWGRVGVDLVPRRAVPGSTISLRAELSPRRATTLRHAEATLEAEEVVEVPDPDGHTLKYERVLAVPSTIFAGQRLLLPGSRYPLDATLCVPPDATPTFRCSGGGLQWQVRLRFGDEPDVWEDVFPIVVVGRVSQ